MIGSTLKNNLYWKLFRVAIEAKHNLMDIADSHGLTVMQLYTLCLLEADTSIPMNSLSATLSCDASNVTGIVERLLQHDYIKREENPKDRREKMITLSQKGIKLCEKISETFASAEPKALQSLSKEEQIQLHQILSKVIDSSPPRI
ncbi:MAG TPA: MarR family transcriptional regulator [Candidatus Saccharimonadales bacterium]|nr:MarR family transcriptional regulator [Candidatus Saccharimonadales bacterium]